MNFVLDVVTFQAEVDRECAAILWNHLSRVLTKVVARRILLVIRIDFKLVELVGKECHEA